MKNSINKTADEMFEDLTDEECLDFAVDMLANQVMKGVTGFSPTDIEKVNYSYFLRENKKEQQESLEKIISVMQRALKILKEGEKK